MKPMYYKKNIIAFFLLGIMLSTIFPITIPSSAKSQILSPFKQVQQGVHVLDVICSDGMVLILKSETAMPFCVDESSVNTLLTRGWAIMPSEMTVTQSLNTNGNFSKVQNGPRDYHLVFLVSSANPQYENNLNVFAKYLQRGDSLLVEGYENSESEITQKIQKIKLMQNPGVNVDAIRIYNGIDDLTNKVPNLPKGFSYIGYDYEQGAGFSPEFTVDEARSALYFDQARHAVLQYNVRTGSNASLILMPPFGQLGKLQWDWGQAAKHTGIMSIQFQAFIKDSNFLNYVVDTIARVKQESVSTKVLVQVSLVPTRGTPQDTLHAITLLHHLPIDSFLVFYHPNQTSDLEQFLNITPK